MCCARSSQQAQVGWITLMLEEAACRRVEVINIWTSSVVLVERMGALKGAVTCWQVSSVPSKGGETHSIMLLRNHMIYTYSVKAVFCD
jgi:hypothetical protein